MITPRQPNDFVGQVFTINPEDSRASRSASVPIAGVTVTITVGPRSGEHTITDRNGQYLFSDVVGDSLHLRTDRSRFESKEVIVYRSQPTALSDGSVPNYHGDPQRNPGNILIGLAWPDEVRFIMEETLLPYDVLYIEYGTLLPQDLEFGDHNVGGWYGHGLVSMRSVYDPLLAIFDTFAHELAHAHQRAVISLEGSLSWEATHEGRAFVTARAKDWAEVGDDKIRADRTPFFRNSFEENAAEIAAFYWGRDTDQGWRWGHLPTEDVKDLAPNRYQWAVEWLSKK